MSKRNQFWRHFFNALLVVALIITSGLAINYRFSLSHNQEKLAHNIHDYESLNARFDSIVLKSVADELFIDGNHDSAMHIYTNLSDGLIDNQILVKRKDLMQHMADFRL